MTIIERSQKRCSNEIPTEFRRRVSEEIPCDFRTERFTYGVGVKLEEFDESQETESWPFREHVGGLLWLTISIRPDISNAVRSVARYCSALKAIHWKSVLGIIAYISGTCGFGIT